MVFNDKIKVIFIHIPKTGGTSIENALNCKEIKNGYGVINNKAIHHYSWKEYKNKYPKRFKNYYKFTIVRNPYDKILSDYYYLKHIAKLDIDNFQNITFDEYLNYCGEIVKNKLYNKTKYHDHFLPQHKFIFNDNNNLMVNKILRFENFSHINKFIKIRFKKDLQWLNKNKYSEKIILNQEQKDKIYEIYEKDFTLLSYPK